MANFRPAAVYGNTGTNHSDIDITFGAVTATLSGVPETLCVTQPCWRVVFGALVFGSSVLCCRH